MYFRSAESDQNTTKNGHQSRKICQINLQLMEECLKLYKPIEDAIKISHTITDVTQFTFLNIQNIV